MSWSIWTPSSWTAFTIWPFLPVNDGKGDEDLGMVILKSEKGEDGDDYLVIPTDEETDRAYEEFMKELFEDEE